MAETEYFVRLKPRPEKARKGVTRTPSRYMIRGVRFEEIRGWYRIKDLAFAKELRALTHNDKPDGVRIFDVCTTREAAEIQAREKRSKRRRDVEDADEIQTVSPLVAARRAGRRGAISTGDTVPEVEEMIDPDPDGTELEAETEEEADGLLGRLDGGLEQELDDGDDLLEQGGREPKPPKVRGGKPEVSARARTRKKPAAEKSEKAPKKKGSPKPRERVTEKIDE